MTPGLFPSHIHTHRKHTFAYSFLGVTPTHSSKISLCSGQSKTAKKKIDEMGPWEWVPLSRSQHKGWARRGREHSALERVLTSVPSSDDLQRALSPCPLFLS